MDQQASHAGPQKSLLVVAGSGRSGTSLFTVLAGRLGLYIPQPELKPNDSNPSGFGEPRWAVAFHKDLLRSVDVTHDDGRPQAWEATARVADRKPAQQRLRTWLEEQFDKSDRVVVKDPRLAWFHGLYANVAADLSADLCMVTMLRHPAETVRSKQLAYGARIDSTTRMAGWLNMMLNIEHRTRHLPRVIIQYHDLLNRWQQTFSSAEKVLPIELVSGATPAVIEAADALVDPSLRRTAGDWSELDMPAPLQEFAERTFHLLSSLAVSPDGEVVDSPRAELDEIREAYTSHYRDSEALVKSSLNAAATAERRRIAKQQKNEHQGTQRKTAQTQQAPPTSKDSTAQPRAASGLKGVAAKLLRRSRS